MTRKDPSPVDLEFAESATDTSLSRRGLVTRVGAAGLSGLAAALLVDRSSLAVAAGPNDRPGVPTESDDVLLAQAMAFELALGDLYRTASEGAFDDLALFGDIMASNHRSYAEAIAGATGISAGAADPKLIADNFDAFMASTTEALLAAHSLEQTAVATHTALIARYESNTAITLTASIAVVEARHATVIADILGVENLDVLFGNDQSPLEFAGDSA
mgnify:CR=1 FL=1